ncbi:MAG: sensor histidine kinase [Acidimicrobiales bacterium]
MTSPLEIVWQGATLDPGARRHLDRLMGSWNLLADLCFSDLVLYVPVDPPLPGQASTQLIVVGQVRPTTSQTVQEVDLVGQVVAASEHPLVSEALRTGALAAGEQRHDFGDGHVRLECIPVRYSGRVLAVLCRFWSPSTARRRGTLEKTYLELFARLSVMVSDGLFPFPDDDLVAESAPRVGDGVFVVDEQGRISFASPNAVSALHRTGIVSSINGSTLPALGLDTAVVRESFAKQLPVVEEIERRSDMTVVLRCIPLVERGQVTGGLVLVRDVTDVRRRDRLLLTKDAAIREVHHRVKNNLQTISSLLRLQARRIEQPAGRIALSEAERRIRAIAVVHEILSRESGDQVPFDEIVHSLVRIAQDSSPPSRPVALRVEGQLGDIPSEMATPLSVVIAELLQNAVEHAFSTRPETDDTEPQAPREATGSSAAPREAPRIDLCFRRGQDSYEVMVRDNGAGLPPDFDIEATRSLGLSIVRDLVRNQLGGTIAMSVEAGTVVRLTVPMARRQMWAGPPA